MTTFLSLFLFLYPLSLVLGHGGPMRNSYTPKSSEAAHFMAEWVSYEVDEVYWVNFSIQVHNNGMKVLSLSI
jgi:hypothetical protein